MRELSRRVQDRARGDDALALRQSVLPGGPAVGKGRPGRVLQGKEEGGHRRAGRDVLRRHRPADRADRGPQRPVRARGKGPARLLHQHRPRRRRADALATSSRPPSGWTPCSTNRGTRSTTSASTDRSPSTSAGRPISSRPRGSPCCSVRWPRSRSGWSDTPAPTRSGWPRCQGAILEQRRREQLIFARWTMVMLHFEKALYEDPDQDLNRLWWDDVARCSCSSVRPIADSPTGPPSPTSRSPRSTTTTTCWANCSPRNCATSWPRWRAIKARRSC